MKERVVGEGFLSVSAAAGIQEDLQHGRIL
jgi:hypothetical protein